MGSKDLTNLPEVLTDLWTNIMTSSAINKFGTYESELATKKGPYRTMIGFCGDDCDQISILRQWLPELDKVKINFTITSKKFGDSLNCLLNTPGCFNAAMG